MSRGDSSDEESRTITIGTKRARSNVALNHISTKRIKYSHHRHRVGYQDLRDFAPRGAQFGHSSLAHSPFWPTFLHHPGQRSEASSSSSDYQMPQTSTTGPAMNWNNTSKSSQGSIRTSLHGGGGYGQNRLATGFQAPSERPSHAHVAPHDIVEISDDSEAEDESDEGGMMLNVDAAPSLELSLEKVTVADLSDAEEGEIEDGDENSHQEPSRAKVEDGKKRPNSKGHHNTTLPKSSAKMPHLSSPIFQGARILADLSSDDLEKQIKYTLFHLPRNQIDLSRPVICLACLNEGHVDQYCPRVMCLSCGGQTNHRSRLCPKQARCSKCGQRGHAIDACRSKLKTPELDPCEICGGPDHIEASCTQRFFPAQVDGPRGELQLWISCAQCGSKDHLAGDCPEYDSLPAPAWSLRAYSRYKIINLSLQTGVQAQEKEAQNRGLRPEGIQIRGRGAPANRYPRRGESPQSDGDDDFTTRLASNRTRQPSPRNHLRFDDNDRRRMNRDHGDDYYRMRSNRTGPSNDNDHYHPAPSSGYRDRNGYGGPRGDQEGRDYQSRRPRSRSPPRRGGANEGDRWRSQPPLPRGAPPHSSLPARPAPPRHPQQQQNPSQQPSKKGKRGAGKGKGGGGGGGGGGTAAVVRPMPSSAKHAWNKGRL